MHALDSLFHGQRPNTKPSPLAIAPHCTCRQHAFLLLACRLRLLHKTTWLHTVLLSMQLHAHGEQATNALFRKVDTQQQSRAAADLTPSRFRFNCPATSDSMRSTSSRSATTLVRFLRRSATSSDTSWYAIRMYGR